jgi:hypothetical protein
MSATFEFHVNESISSDIEDRSSSQSRLGTSHSANMNSKDVNSLLARVEEQDADIDQLLAAVHSDAVEYDANLLGRLDHDPDTNHIQNMSQ